MIECIPEGFCSWNYRIAGDGISARIRLSAMSEAGSIETDAGDFQIGKHGFIHPMWVLSNRSGSLAEATKPSTFKRRFDIQSAGLSYCLAASTLGRTMALEGPGHDLIYQPVHIFTRRARIHGTWHEPHILLFGFWLAALIWRRTASAATSS